MRRHQRSPEFEHYRRTLQCPNGHRHALTYLEGSGQVVENLTLRDRLTLENPFPWLNGRTPVELFGRLRQMNHDRSGGLSIIRFRADSSFTCCVCGGQWPVFVQQELKIVDHRETGLLSQTPIGSQERRLDHTHSLENSKMKLTFKRKWTERVEVGFERVKMREVTRFAGMKGSYGPLSASAEIKQRITDNLKETHSVVSETEKTTVHEREYELPAGQVTVITIHWKQVWRECECHVRFPGNEEIARIPYRVADDVVFDEEVKHL